MQDVKGYQLIIHDITCMVHLVGHARYRRSWLHILHVLVLTSGGL